MSELSDFLDGRGQGSRLKRNRDRRGSGRRVSLGGIFQKKKKKPKSSSSTLSVGPVQSFWRRFETTGFPAVWRTWLILGVFWGLFLFAVCGTLLLLVARGGQGTPVVSEPVTSVVSGPPAAAFLTAAGVGEGAVRAWVTGSGGEQAFFLPGVKYPKTKAGVAVQRTVPVEVKLTDEALDRWTVRVATVVAGISGVVLCDIAIRYFPATGEWQAEAPPAVVAPGSRLHAQVGPSSSNVYDPQAEKTITEFLGAWLTGEGDPARYVTAESGIGFFSEAPFSTVELESIKLHQEEKGADLIATIDLLALGPEEEVVVPLRYTMQLLWREGLPVISRLGPTAPQS